LEAEQFTFPVGGASWQNSQFVCEINIKTQSKNRSAKFCDYFERITLRVFLSQTVFEYGALKLFDLPE